MLDEIRQQYKKNDVIFAQGQGAAFLYLIESGEVGIVVEKDKQLHLINRLGPKNFIGEVEFFHGARRAISAVALSDTTIYCFRKSDVIEILEKCPQWVQDIMTTLGERNYEAMKIIVEHNIFNEDVDAYWKPKEKKEVVEQILAKRNSV